MTNENPKPTDKPETVTTLAPSPCSADTPEIPCNPPGLDEYIAEGAAHNSRLLRKHHGRNLLSKLEGYPLETREKILAATLGNLYATAKRDGAVDWETIEHYLGEVAKMHGNPLNTDYTPNH